MSCLQISVPGPPASQHCAVHGQAVDSPHPPPARAVWRPAESSGELGVGGGGGGRGGDESDAMDASPAAVWRRPAQPGRGSRIRCVRWNRFQALRHQTPDTTIRGALTSSVRCSTWWMRYPCPPQRRPSTPPGIPTAVAGCAQGLDPGRSTRVPYGSGHRGPGGWMQSFKARRGISTLGCFMLVV